MMLDAAHIIIGILIVALAVISFLNPEDHMLPVSYTHLRAHET